MINEKKKNNKSKLLFRAVLYIIKLRIGLD